MFFMNLGSLRRGVRKLASHWPATVTEVSCPSDVMLGAANVRKIVPSDRTQITH